MQDVAYSTMLREPRRALHARIAETLESQFPEIAESQPELLARHYAKAGLIEKSARLWGRAGQRSQKRSALVEAAEQLGQALAQIETLPSTFDLRREQIILQVALLNTLMHENDADAGEKRPHQMMRAGKIQGVEADADDGATELLHWKAVTGLKNSSAKLPTEA